MAERKKKERILMQDVKRAASRRNALVYGTDASSVALSREIASGGEFNVVGFVSSDEDMAGRLIGDVHVYLCRNAGDLRRLEWHLGGIDCVFFPGNTSAQTMINTTKNEQSNAL